MKNKTKAEPLDTDISFFIKKIRKRYGLNVHVVLGGQSIKKLVHLVPLETLVDEAYSAMCIYDPTLQSISSLKERTRKRDVIIWTHCFYHIAWHYGYSKTAIGRSLKRDHATVIHGIKTVNSYLSISDLMITTIYNILMNHYKDNVGNFSEHSKR